MAHAAKQKLRWLLESEGGVAAHLRWHDGHAFTTRVGIHRKPAAKTMRRLRMRGNGESRVCADEGMRLPRGRTVAVVPLARHEQGARCVWVCSTRPGVCSL